MSKGAVVVLLVLAAQPAFAQAVPNGSPRARVGAVRLAQSDQYRKLFETPPLAKIAGELAAKAESPKRSVVCGLTIVAGDPQSDPKFFVGGKNNGVHYTMRKVDPPICKP